MKKWLPWIIVAVFAAWILSSLRVPADKQWAYRQFGRLPVIANGRVYELHELINGPSAAPLTVPAGQ